MSTAMEAIKFDICCAARALFRAGLSAGVAGHLSVAVGENSMLMNRFGPSFGTLASQRTSAPLISRATSLSTILRLIRM